ncbi:double zinc ribbon domain-containing protein [Candidatus Binatus sp.]|uniref:double zinc ribbon domain-containing protein n=1 Tax=Candidatus Binatus sp. TaxID=2811406 RepID=UPI0039C85CEC
MPALAQKFSTVLDFLYPPRCAACGTPLASEPGRRVCARCVARVELVPNPRCEICGGPLESATSDLTRCARCLERPPRYRIARTGARWWNTWATNCRFRLTTTTS